MLSRTAFQQALHRWSCRGKLSAGRCYNIGCVRNACAELSPDNLGPESYRILIAADLCDVRRVFTPDERTSEKLKAELNYRRSRPGRATPAGKTIFVVGDR